MDKTRRLSDGKRALLIVFAILFVFFGGDWLIRTLTLSVLQRRVAQVRVGMPEREAERITRKEAFDIGKKREIWVADPDGVFRSLVLQENRKEGYAILIESGKVAAVSARITLW